MDRIHGLPVRKGIWMRRGIFQLAVLLSLLPCFDTGLALAQSADLGGITASESAVEADVNLSDPVIENAVQEMVSRLSDREVLQLLLDRLDAAAQTHTALSGTTFDQILALLSVSTESVASSIAFNISSFGAFLAAQGKVFERFFIWLGGTGLERVSFSVALAVGFGLLAERAVHWAFFRRPVARPIPVEARNLMMTMRRAGARLWYEMLGALVFAVVASIALHLSRLEGAAPLLRLILVCLIALPRFSIALLRFFFKPDNDEAKLLSVDDRSGNILYWNFVGMSFLVGLALLISTVNQRMGGPPDAEPVAFWFWFNVIFFGWLAILFGLMRDGWRSIMLGGRGDVKPAEVWAIRAYPLFAVITILVVWVLVAAAEAMNAAEILRGGRPYISLLIILSAPLLDTLINAVVRHFTPPMRGEGEVARTAYEASFNAYVRIGRVLVFGAGLLFLAELWNVTLTSIAMGSAGVGEQFATTLVRVGLIAICGYLVWEVARLVINIRLANEQVPDGHVAPIDDGEPHISAPASRLGTILPAISKALQIVILTMTTLTILSNLGVDVTALLAGAGIVGIAVGFGSQKLVSDVVSGVFFLIDDAFRVNEFIDAGGLVGTVEKISLRSLRLRDAKGPILIVPYSEIKTVTNFGRDWGIMKMRFTVPFDTDVEQVRKIFKKIGQEMMQDPLLAPGFIEPFKSQGVYEFNDHGIVVRGKFTHKPGAQFEIRKRAFTRIKQEFDKAGIQFARREVIVNLGESRETLTEEQARKIGAAAAEDVAQADRDAAKSANPI